jgi:hypothetical protein
MMPGDHFNDLQAVTFVSNNRDNVSGVQFTGSCENMRDN